MRYAPADVEHMDKSGMNARLHHDFFHLFRDVVHIPLASSLDIDALPMCGHGRLSRTGSACGWRAESSSDRTCLPER